MSTAVVNANSAHDSHDAEHHMPYDPMGIKIGMWLFLFTELLLFGGLFIIFAVYSHMYPREFHQGSSHLSVPMATFNTFLLITSSMTIAQSITALRTGNKKLCLSLLTFTIACAAGFLVVKSFEWGAKFHHDLYPGTEVYFALQPGESAFFSLYYLMTGLHALHVIIGGILIAVVMRAVSKGTVNQEKYAFLENAGLYWHLVDLIWIYLFPLFYLVG